MAQYIVRRLLGIVPVIFGISLFAFLLLRLIPGDPALLILGEKATPTQWQALREQLGLNRALFVDLSGKRPFYDTQYITFMGDLLHGNLGDSIVHKRPVFTELRERFPATVELALTALLIAVTLGMTLGILAAIRRGSLVDTGMLLLALLGVSIPVFWLGLMFQYLFAVNWHILPISLRVDSHLSRNFQLFTGLYTLDGLLRGRPDITLNALYHLIMPASVLATVPLAIIARMTRSALLEVLGQDYIRTAQAKGLRGRTVILRHALRNALLPVVTIVGLQLGLLLSGTILTETVFAWPGIGTWLLEGIQGRDYPVVQGGVIFVALVFVLVNTLVDLLYVFLDPRIQYR
ncbi:MAG: ABC transporter permease [Chloroflexi bacterium]|nr:ABC transporter permease [Chloroflexota bacterium]